VFESINEMKIISKIAEMSIKVVSGYLGIDPIFETSSEKYEFKNLIHRIHLLSEANRRKVHF
jgi:hypothetical protein